jgi:hypothetical protein
MFARTDVAVDCAIVSFVDRILSMKNLKSFTTVCSLDEIIDLKQPRAARAFFSLKRSPDRLHGISVAIRVADGFRLVTMSSK